MAYNPQNLNGQATSANSTPVVIASDQSAIPISATALPLPTGASTETTLASLNTKVTAVNTGAVTISTPLPTGTNAIGTVTSNIGTTGGLALDATFTGGNAKVTVRSATKGTSTAADVTSNPVDANTQALHVNLSGVNAVNATLTAETTKVIGTVNISAAQTIAAVTSITNALPTGTNAIGSVTQIGNSFVSTANSTTANLAAGGTFTGTGEDVSEYSTVMVTIFSSHVSATDGFQLQFSSDGTNWDYGDSFSIPATTGKTFSVGVTAKFYRVVYTNGATATTSLRIQSLYSKAAKKNSSVRPQDGRTNDNDFEEVLSFGVGYNGTSWDRVRLSAKGVQATTALATQDLKDSGRARVSITFMAVAPAVADTLLSLVKVTNGVAAAGATSIGVAAGKTLSISSITFSIKANAAAAAFATLTFRQNPAGATAIGSIAECRVDVGNTAATIGASDKVEVLFPDGMEFSGTQTLGISLAAQATTNIISISINGFEY